MKSLFTLIKSPNGPFLDSYVLDDLLPLSLHPIDPYYPQKVTQVLCKIVVPLHVF